MADAKDLMLRFQADTAPARAAMTELAKTGASQLALLGTAAAAAGAKMDGAAGGYVSWCFRVLQVLSGIQAAHIVFGAVAASSVAVAIEKLAEYRTILESANAAGVSTDFFQKFTQAAGKAADSAKLMQQALNTAKGATREGMEGNRLGDRLNEFGRNGGLSAAGDAARFAYGKATTTEERTQAALKVMDDLLDRGRKLEAMDIGEKLFGREASDALIDRADKAGKSLTDMVNTTADKKVVSPEQIENARQLEERLEAARAKMADGLRPVLEDLERIGTAIYSGWVGIDEKIAGAVKRAGDLYVALKNVVSAIPSSEQVGQLVEDEMTIRAAKRGAPKNVFDKIDDVILANRRAAQGRDMLNSDAVPGLPVYNPNQPVALGKNDPLFGLVPPKRPIADLPNPSPARGGGGGKGSSTDSDLEFYEKYVANIEKAAAALKTEIETQGMATFEKEKAIATSKAYAEFKAKDIELSDAQKAKLDALIEAQARLKEQLEKTKDSMQAQRDLVNFLGTSVSGFLSDIVSGGKNAEQALMNLAKKLADAAFQAALLGQGPLAQLFGMAGTNGNPGGLFGMLFSGFKGMGGGDAVSTAFSGYNVTGLQGSFDVGSRYVPRDMLAMVHQGEEILTPGQRNAKNSGGAGAAITINVTGTGNSEVRELVAIGVRQGMAQVASGEQQRNRSYSLRMAR